MQSRRVTPGRTARCAGGWTLVTVLALGLGLSGCKLLAVGTMVGKRFVPALAKGNKKKLIHHSSWRLAWYWDGFTDREIETAVKGNPAMRGRKKGKPGSKARKAKAPSVGLVSFRSKGNKARLVARRGKMRIAFDCVYQGGRWRVDDVTLPLKGRKTRLTQVLKLLLAAKAIQSGLETGSRYLLVNVSTPRLRRAVWDRLSDAELEALTTSTRPKKRRTPRGKKRKGSKIGTTFHADHAVVTLTGGALSAAIVLRERDGQYWVDEVKLKLGQDWHRLSALVGYLQPALGLLRWARRHVLQPSSDAPPTRADLSQLIARMRGALSETLWQRTFAWLKPHHLKLLPWKAIRKAMQPTRPKLRVKPPEQSSSGFGPKAIRKFKRTGDRLEMALAIPDLAVTLTMVRQAGSWRVHRATMTRKGQTLKLADLLEALAPLVRLGARAGRLVPVILTGTAKSNPALAELMTAVRAASSADLNRRLWSRIPAGLLQHVPLHVLPAALGGLRSGAAKGGGGQTGLPTPKLPKVTLVKVRQTQRRLAITLQIAEARITVVMLREAAGWRLDDVLAPLAGKQRSMKHTLALMAPAAALAHAVLSGKGAPLREAVSPRIRRTVVDPLLRILGPRFGSLMHTLRTQTLKLPDLPKKQTRKRKKRRRRRRARRPRRPPRPRPLAPRTQPRPAAKGTGPAVKFKSLHIEPDKRRAVIALQLGPMAPLKIVLTQGKDQVWRVDDLEFPLGGKQLTLRRAGPILVPLFGFGISLLTRYLPGIRRACSRSFNRAVWRRLTRKKFNRLLKQFMPKSSGRSGGRRVKAGGGKSRTSGLPRLLVLRIKDTGRWHWAQVELKISGRRIRISLVGVKDRWSVHDLHLTVGGQMLSLKTAAALLL